MSARRRRWIALVVLGVTFTALNLIELVFLEGGWSRIVGVGLGLVLLAICVKRRSDWQGVKADA